MDSRISIRSTGAFVYTRDAVVFAVCYLLLDWASYLHPLGPFNITLWNPPPALCIAWIVLGGLRYLPAVVIAVTFSDVVIRQAPGGMMLSIATSLAVALIYVGIAALVRLWALPEGKFERTRQLGAFALIASMGSCIAGVVYVGLLWVSGFPAGESFGSAVLRFWLGDLVGIIVTTPLLLVAADQGARSRFFQLWPRPETWLQFATMIVATYLVFLVIDGDPSKYFYALFLPLIWIAVRCGLAGAVVVSAIVQSGVVFLAHADENLHSLAVAELQALVAALSLTGMFLGVLLDERERIEAELKRSLHLAAAGEMAGAIAHEINQPLGAMLNFGRACQLLIERDRLGETHPDLANALSRMTAEGRRASDVVARLREFFRSGSTRLEAVSIESLIAAATQVARGLNRNTPGSGAVDFEVLEDASMKGLSVFADRLQLELILRNLIANAFESVADPSVASRRVTLSARRLGTDHVQFVVSDSGHGIPLSLRERLFTPFSTSKSMGMGLGLAISRAIAEAHGGTLVAANNGRGEFLLTLPVRGGDEHVS